MLMLPFFDCSVSEMMIICCCFLPRCMECRRGLAMRILSVCLSVKRVNCDKTEERSIQILYHGWGRPLLPEMLGQPASVRAKLPILN